MADVLDLLPPVRRALHAASVAVCGDLHSTLWQLSEDDLDLALGELRAHEARCAWLRLGLVQQARDRSMHARTGALDLPRWLADRYGLDPATARSEVDLALAVRADGVAAATGAALAAGRIDEGRARLVVTMLDRLPGPAAEDVLTEAEQILLAVAEHADSVAVRRVGRELREKLTPVSTDGPQPHESDRVNEVRLTALEPGWWRLSGTVDAEFAAIIDAAMAASTHPQQHRPPRATATDSDTYTDTDGAATRPASVGGDDADHADHADHANHAGCGDDAGPDEGAGRRVGAFVRGGEPSTGDSGSTGGAEISGAAPVGLLPLPQRRAAALRELCLLALRSGALPTHGGVASTVLVTISLADLQQQIGAAQLLGLGGRLAAADARRIACDAGIVPVLLGSDGRPLEYGRSVRGCPPGLRRILDLRDGGCVFPDCGRLPIFCDAHHIVHWSVGGTTDECNLCLLCPHHHRQVHRQHWTLTLTGGLIQFRPPVTVDPQQRPRTHARQRIRSITSPPPGTTVRPDRR